MNELPELAIAAHGGPDRWYSYRSVSLELSIGGAFWQLKGQAGLFANGTYEADTRRQRATLGRLARTTCVSASRHTGCFWKRMRAR